MFERYTEPARKAVFFARWEASNFGANQIDTEHLLLGVLRADANLAEALRVFHLDTESIRERIRKEHPGARERISTSVDLPISVATKYAMEYGAEEAKRTGQSRIGPECLLIGLAREESSFAARILREAGLTLPRLREIATRTPSEPAVEFRGESQSEPAEISGILPDFARDLTHAASLGELNPLIGREAELGRVTHLLARRNRSNAALIGPAGAGKTAVIHGLAQRLYGGIMEELLDYRAWTIEAALLFPVKPGQKTQTNAPEMFDALASAGKTLLAIEGLFDLALSRSDWGLLEAGHVLEPHLARRSFRVIATGSPDGLRLTLAKAPALARHFEIVNIAPPDPSEAVAILHGLKTRYEQFHGVAFAPGAIEMAVLASGRFLLHRSLPDRALDLLDEAAARVRVRRETGPPEIIGIRKRIRQHERDLDHAICNHQLAAAREYSDAEHAEREKLRVLLEQRGSAPAHSTVTAEEIEQVVADRVGIPMDAVHKHLDQKGPGELEDVMRELASRLPVNSNEWLSLLAAYIVRASDGDIDALVDALRAARVTRQTRD